MRNLREFTATGGFLIHLDSVDEQRCWLTGKEAAVDALATLNQFSSGEAQEWLLMRDTVR